MKESPDRWYSRLTKTLRPHGRFAVISSCATAGLLLVVGGVVFASQSDRTVSDLGSAPKSAVSSTVDSVRPTPGGVTVATTTTTLSPGSNTSVTRQTTSSTPGSMNTTPPVPTTVPAGATTTTALLPATPTPSTGAPATTTTTTGPVADSSLVVTADWTTQPTPDDPIVNLRITASDSNGYISSILVLWNDGTQTMYTNSQTCTLPLKSTFSTAASHSYGTSGTYTVAATAMSTDCLGAAQQQLTRYAKPATVGGSPTTTTTSTTAAP